MTTVDLSTIKGVIFDKDGTLIDFHQSWTSIGLDLAMAAAVNDEERAEELMVLAGYDSQSKRFRPDSVFAAGTNAELIDLWFPTYTQSAKLEILSGVERIISRIAAERAVPVPQCRDVLQFLFNQSMKLAVVTNDSTKGAEETLSALGISQFFTACFGYDAVANPKPAIDPVIAFCDTTGLSPRQIAVIGDNHHDILMGKRAGVALTVGVLTGTGTRQTLREADLLLDSIADFTCLFETQPVS
ncbi:HAD family hydrolase [Limoniibacter endophyticus]|uniref:Haloacid dehalogenase n=1 Tax=Limoniibacter endophyticus TaxID=1565040 RepID=A0A8J3GHL8_9HYPH|nr:HAD family hydrolase [Limoniibacter endophyticus]GHC80045.1 haloacid dehalogenase [Limoniibacter endophyticus]